MIAYFCSAGSAPPWRPSARPLPEKLCFSGNPIILNPRAESIRPPARKFPASGREFCLDAPKARLTFVRKRPRCHAFGFDSFAMAALAAICSASFLLCPSPEPTGSPFRSTSTKKRLAWSGP